MVMYIIFWYIHIHNIYTLNVQINLRFKQPYSLTVIVDELMQLHS